MMMNPLIPCNRIHRNNDLEILAGKRTDQNTNYLAISRRIIERITAGNTVNSKLGQIANAGTYCELCDILEDLNGRRKQSERIVFLS